MNAVSIFSPRIYTDPHGFRVHLCGSAGYILARVIAFLGSHGFALIFEQGMKDLNHEDLEEIAF
jgi:hypothetical protein